MGWLIKYYAWVKPACSLVKVNWPFRRFSGAISEYNAGFLQWQGLAETLRIIINAIWSFDKLAQAKKVISVHILKIKVIVHAVSSAGI